MKQFRFMLLCVAITVMAAGVTGCKKGVYDEKQALAAQKDLLQFKYDQEIKLEQLKQAGQLSLQTAQYANQTALYTLQYNFGLKTLAYTDSISKTYQDYLSNLTLISARKRDISVLVEDLVSGTPVIGAEVTIPTITGTVIKGLTDSSGRAYFSPNANIPNPASAIVTKTGYAAGSVFATIVGSATIDIWNQATANNIVKGRVYIENNLTNDSVEVAKNAFINVFSYVNIKGYNQRFDWTAYTDNNGDYLIKVPDLSQNLQFAWSAIEGTSKMYTQSVVPGLDSLPTVQNVPATYFLGTGAITTTRGSTYSVNSSSIVELPDNNPGFVIPSSVNRYHVAAAADSNGRGHYIKALTFGTSTLSTSATSDSAWLSGSSVGLTFTAASLNSAAEYVSNSGTPKNRYTSKYLAGTTVRDTVNATLYDVLANADGYWKTAPVLQFELTTDSTTGIKFKYISKLIQKTGGKTIKPDNNFTHNTSLSNLIKTYSGIISFTYNSRNVNTGFTSITTSNINYGKTYTQDLSFGAGKLKYLVR